MLNIFIFFDLPQCVTSVHLFLLVDFFSYLKELSGILENRIIKLECTASTALRVIFLKRRTYALAIKLKPTCMAYCLPFHIVLLPIMQDKNNDKTFFFAPF